MKKSIVFGALALAGAAFAVESATVGYTTKESAKGKWAIVGVQFETVAGETYLNDLVSGVVGVNYDDGDVWLTTAPQIQVPNAFGGYTLYYYLNDAWDVTNQKTVAGWADSNGNLAAAGEVTPGVAVWFKSVGADANTCISGAVSESDTATVSCPVSFALRANAFPEAITINGNGMTSTDIMGVDYDEQDVWLTTAPQMQVPNAFGGYTLYYYLNDAWDVANQVTVAGWADSNGNLASGTIPAAQGFWTKGVSGAFTLKFTK